MKSFFVDANLFLRYFLDDDKTQADAAERLFRQAEAGKVELFTGPPVFFEAAWTMRSAYNLDHAAVIRNLHGMSAMTGLRLADRPLVESAIQISQATGVNFPDAYIFASARHQQLGAVATFNVGDFKKTGIHTHEPK
jgi:predicted nucleic acid-binding protein